MEEEMSDVATRDEKKMGRVGKELVILAARWATMAIAMGAVRSRAPENDAIRGGVVPVGRGRWAKGVEFWFEIEAA